MANGIKHLFFLTFSLFTLSAHSATVIKTFVQHAGSFHQLEDILIAQGFTHSEASPLLKDKMIPSKWHLNPQTKFLVLKDGPKTEVRFYMEYSDEALVFSKTGSAVLLEKRPINFQVTLKHAEGFIHGSLSESIKKHFDDEWVVNRFEDAFYWDFDIAKRISQSDSFKITVEEKYDEGRLVKYGEVTRAELKAHGQDLRRMLLVKDGYKVFVDPDKLFDDRLFYAPVDYLHISSPFALRRFHPVRHKFQPHLGVDFALPEGSPVYVPRDGVVTEISKKRGNGNFVVIEHEFGLFSIYNHLQAVYNNLKVGQKVKVGEILAYVGCTGYCTSPHLHFSVRRGTHMINPNSLTRPFPFKVKDYRNSPDFKNLLFQLRTAANTH